MDRQSEYRQALESLHFTDEQKRQIAARAAEGAKRPRRRSWGGMALAAACMTLLLAGTAVAAAGGPATLADWVSSQWQESIGAPLTQEHQAVLDALTQPVGVSDTDNGVTVTLDSVTVGDSCLWLLLKAEGDLEDEENAYLYHFGDVEMNFDFSPDTVDTPGGYSWDYGYTGVGADGRLTLLMRYTITLGREDSLAGGYEAVLELGDLLYSDETRLRGQWSLPFTMEQVEQEAVMLERAVVPAWDHETGGESSEVELRDIRVTGTGVRFSQERVTAMRYPEMTGLVMEDGTLVTYGGGGSRSLDEDTWISDYYWDIPVDFDQAVALRFGDLELPLK